MSSGKQTSFQFGEVSKEQHYRTNDVAYSNALHTLHNMYVKRAGGITRKPGSKILSINPDNQNVPSGIISRQVYKTFSYPDMFNAVVPLGFISMQIEDDALTVVTIKVFKDTVSAPLLINVGYNAPAGEGLENIKVVFGRDKVFIHGLTQNIDSAFRFITLELLDLDTALPNLVQIQSPTIPAITPISGIGNSSGNIKLAAGVLQIAVQYLITFEFKDGTETPYFRHSTSAAVYDLNGFAPGAAAGELLMPGDGVITSFLATTNFNGAFLKKLKYINIYRAPISGTDLSLGAAVLVSKQFQHFDYLVKPLVDVTVYNIIMKLVDSGASVATRTAPIDFSMFSDYVGINPLEGSTCSCIYQERHVIGLQNSDNPNISNGDMAVTRIGALSQIARPVISSNADSFQMSVPVGDGSPVRQLIAATRMLSFTDRGTYLMAGGESGILTPTAIFPQKVSAEGGSRTVVPLIVGSAVVYLNASHTKLMAIVFGKENQAQEIELSKLSDHLLDRADFIEMNILPSDDNVVVLLKQNGDLVAFSLSEQYVAGFSSIDMRGGKVETMTLVGEASEPTLLLSVVRNGIRYRETIRDNTGVTDLKTQAYSDGSWAVGDRFLNLTSQGYSKIEELADNVLNAKSFIRYEYMNITTGTDYDAGSVLTLTSDILFAADYIASDRIKYFYEEDGETKFLVLELLSAGVGPGPYTYTARANYDIPAQLQDVDGGALDAEEKLALQSRWLRAFTRVESIVGFPQFGMHAIYLGLKDGASFDPLVTPDGEVEVAVLGEGIVYSSPLNYLKATLSIKKETGGLPYLELPELVTHVVVGDSYQSDMQTLPIEVSDSRTLTDSKKIVGKVGIALYNTVGGHVGAENTPPEEMAEIRPHDSVGEGTPDLGFSGYTAPDIPSEWSKDGMIRIVQLDPVPMTILSVYPKGMAGD